MIRGGKQVRGGRLAKLAPVIFRSGGMKTGGGGKNYLQRRLEKDCEQEEGGVMGECDFISQPNSRKEKRGLEGELREITSNISRKGA